MCVNNITAGFVQSGTCITPVGGFSDNSVYIFNENEVASATASTVLGEVTDVVMTGATTGFKLEAEKDSVTFKEELQEDGTYTQTFEFALRSDSTLERNFVNSLKGSRICVIARDRNDKFPMAGFAYNGNVTTPASSTIEAVGLELTGQTGDWAIETFGNQVIMTAIGLKEKAPYFYETSIAATVANLESYI